MERIPTATNPTNVTLAQAELLRLVGEAGVVGLSRDGRQLSAHFSSLQALERRGLVTLKTEPTGYDHPAWKQTWLVTGLGLDVLKAGLVHTDTEQDADGITHRFVFLNGQQVGEVQRFAAHGTKGWQGIDRHGVRSLIYPRRDMAVAWVAGGAR